MSGYPKEGALDGEQPGFYRGRHFTEYFDEVRSLKRDGRLEEAARLLLKLVEATEAESRATGRGLVPWCYKHLAIVYRKQKDPVKEKRLLLRLAEQVPTRGSPGAELLQRLHAVGVSEAELAQIEARFERGLAAVLHVSERAGGVALCGEQHPGDGTRWPPSGIAGVVPNSDGSVWWEGERREICPHCMAGSQLKRDREINRFANLNVGAVSSDDGRGNAGGDGKKGSRRWRVLWVPVLAGWVLLLANWCS